MDNQVRSTGAESCKKFGNPWYFSFKSQGRKSSIIQRKTKPGLAPRACSLNAAVCNRCRDLSTESPKGVRHSWAGLPYSKEPIQPPGCSEWMPLWNTMGSQHSHHCREEGGSWALEAEPVCSLNCSPGRSRLLPCYRQVKRFLNELSPWPSSSFLEIRQRWPK